MAAATYVSVLVRSHLRPLAPLPKDELPALKRTIAELGAVGRNLNQIARAINQGDHIAAHGLEYVVLMLKIANALRAHGKGLLAANHWPDSRGHGQGNAEGCD